MNLPQKRDGCSSPPQKIREALHYGSANLCSESGVDLENQDLFTDLGDIELEGFPAPIEAVELLNELSSKIFSS